MDTSLTDSLNGFLFRHDLIEDPVLAYERFSQLLFVGILIVLFFFMRRDSRVAGRRVAVAAAAATALALVAGQVISKLVDRPRPFVAHPESIHLFASHVADPGFPSDHATAAFAIAVAVLLRNRRWGSACFVLLRCSQSVELRSEFTIPAMFWRERRLAPLPHWWVGLLRFAAPPIASRIAPGQSWTG